MSSQPLYQAKVDIDEALRVTEPVVKLWNIARVHTNAPAFSGGVLDAWPAWVVTAFAVLREEENRLKAWVQSERVKEQPHG